MPLEVSRDVRALSRWSGHLGLSLGSPQGIHTSIHLVQWKTSLHSSHCRKSKLLSSQGITLSTLLEAANSGSLSHTYCWGKGRLQVLVESLTNSSKQSWESALFSRWYGVHGAYLEFLFWNWCSSIFVMCVSGNLWSCLKKDKPPVLYDGEWRIALDPKQWSRASSRVDLGHTEHSHSSGDIRVILDSWGCSWGLSGVPSSKSKLLSFFIGNLE